jgi:type VI secretion system protein ImpC
MNQEKDSVRSRLARVRRPQVNITYDLEVEGAVQERSLPFVVGVLADFSGQGGGSTSLRSRRFHAVDVDNFAGFLTRMRPSLEIAIDGGSMVELEFDSLNDFTPQALIARVPELARLWKGRTDVLAQKDRSIRAICQLLDKHGLDIPVVPQGDDPAAAVVAELDRRLSSRLTSIIHHPDFRVLESSWRGLWYLVLQTETSEDLKIELLDISKKALYKDLDKAAAYNQSIIFKKVFEDRFGSFGGEPIGVLIGDYEFSHSPDDIAILRNLAQVAAAAHAPFVAAASAQMFGLDDFTQVTRIRDPAKIFLSPEYASWKAFRASEDTRWIALTVPHVLLRTPYHYQSEEPDPYVFVEDAQGAEALLWG